MKVRRRWSGVDVRPRCELDGKVIIPDQEKAEHKAALIRNRDARRPRMQAFQCAAGHWHVGQGWKKPKEEIVVA